MSNRSIIQRLNDLENKPKTAGLKSFENYSKLFKFPI